MERVRIVAARRQSQGERQVGRPDVDGVEAGRGTDGIEIGQALLGLDHGHDDDLVVGLGHVVGTAVVHGAHRPVRAHADRRVAARRHCHRGFLGVVHQRHDDAVGAEVERLHDRRRLVPGDPHDRDRVGLRDRLQHRRHVLHFGGAVLQVDAQGIETLPRHNLCSEAVGHGKPAQRHAFAITPHLLDLVRSHGGTSDVLGRSHDRVVSIKLTRLLESRVPETARLPLRGLKPGERCLEVHAMVQVARIGIAYCGSILASLM